MGIAALVLGIIAFVLAMTFVLAPLGVVLAVIGLILGIVDTVKKGKSGDKKAISITGMVLCAVMFITLLVESFFILIVGVAVYDNAKNYDANTITESIEKAEISSFNSKFSSYEGTETGTRVKMLLNSISISNSYGNHIVDVYYQALLDDADRVKQEIDSSQRYMITFNKDINGYINRVYIVTSSELTY